jgi:hypothetical protein
MAEEVTTYTRTCAWTGEEFEGKGYILTSTDGTEVVSEAAFMAPWRAASSAPADTAAPAEDPGAGSSDVPPDPTKKPSE